MDVFCIIPPHHFPGLKVLTFLYKSSIVSIVHMTGGCSEGLGAFRFFFTPHSFISFDCCLLFSICVFISLCVASVALTLVFLCVCVFSSHPFWTSSSLDVPAGVTQEEGHTGFLVHLPSAVRALLFVARRIQPSLSLVDREVEFSYLGCTPPLTGLPSLRFYAVASSLFLLSVFLFVFYILSRRCPLLATFLSVLFCLLSLLISDFRFDLVWFRLSCDHGWIRSGSVNVR